MARMPCSPGSNYRRFVETNGRETYPVWCGFFVSPGNRVVPKKGWRYFVAEWHCCHGQVAPLFAERHPQQCRKGWTQSPRRRCHGLGLSRACLECVGRSRESVQDKLRTSPPSKNRPPPRTSHDQQDICLWHPALHHEPAESNRSILRS